MRTIGLFATLLSAASVASVAVASTPADAAAAGCTKYVYSQGGSGSCVQYIQTMVSIMDASSREAGGSIARDGVYGPATKAAVVSYQRDESITADGIVGPQTWHSLCAGADFYYAYPYAPSATAVKQYNSAWSAAGCKSLFPNQPYGLKVG